MTMYSLILHSVNSQSIIIDLKKKKRTTSFSILGLKTTKDTQQVIFSNKEYPKSVTTQNQTVIIMKLAFEKDDLV